tara:strand:- start:7334 stop:7729 length:396 start_codon:yes stop_codon:yes gene_type:complete
MTKDDPDYIASLEKAIEKKYGPETIENPAKHWSPEKEKSYLNDLKEFVKKQERYEQDHDLENVAGVLVSRKLLNKEAISNCLQCKKKLKTLDDEVFLAKFECCFKCYIQFVEGREERWLKGWRPENVTRNS